MSNEPVLIEAKRAPALRSSGQPVPKGEVVIACYDTVAPSLEAELEDLYHHINSSLCHHAVARRARNAYAYVARRGDQPLAVFLFQREDRSIEVFNEMMQIPPEEIERFANYIFSRFPSAARISFSKIGTDTGALSRPWQQYGHAEDIVVSLPDTVDTYLSHLGAKTRRNIRYQMKAIVADFPGFSFDTYENGAIAEHHVAGLIDLKKANMNEKRIKFGITPQEASWMTELARTNGLLVLALLDGKVCGGSLSFRLGEHYFALLNGYDTRFAKYSLGMLCCYLAMTEKIQRGAREAHLLWGRNPYKFKLLGVARDVANLDIYRSRLQYCRYGRRAFRNALDNFLQQQKRMLLENEQRSGFLPSLLGRVVKLLRNLKRSNFRPVN